MLPPQPLALYVHWPFCKAKCPYCDFNSHVTDSVDHKHWATNLKRELDHMAAKSGREGSRLNSIFFGGGTPSLMAPETMAAVIAHARDLFQCGDGGGSDDNIEITMEANPTSVEAAKLTAFRDAGANRLSMGIQSLDTNALSFLGREHTADEALSALTLARQLFSRVSADFIYALPDQREDEWRGELEKILSLGLEHLSLYQLTLEAGTAFYSQHQRGALDVPDASSARGLFDLTQDMTAAAGIPAYEISNHAVLGEESQHNLIYWGGGDWLGVGPGAYGRFWLEGRRIETRSRRAPASWLDDVTAKGHGIDQDIAESPSDYGAEAMMMGLRLHRGVDLNHIASLAGVEKTWLNRDKLNQLIDAGLMAQDQGRLRLTREGQPLLNSILSAILLI